MISTATTLILGAGASCPYGFPSGARLRRQICDELNGSGKAFVAIEKVGHQAGEILAFRNAFYRSQITSIDRFLANNKAFWPIGKAAIAAMLIRCEDEAKLLEERDAGNDHWYRYLWERMDQSWDGFLSNNLRIITFNYDRSLEMFLAIALSEFHQKRLDEALKKVSEFPIVHVYGTLGKLGPWGPPLTRPYSSTFRPEAMKFATDSIRVIPEHRGNQEDQDKLRDMIGSAQRICYLGFAYDPVNVERLGLRDALPQYPNNWAPPDAAGTFRHGKDVLGTTYGLKSEEAVAGVRAVMGQMSRFRNLQCEEFLREFGVLL